MSKVSLKSNLPATPDAIWKLVGGFNALPDWHPAIAKSEITTEGNTTFRRLTLAGGGSILEKLEKSDDDEHRYSYSILESPLPVANYSGTIRVTEAAGGGSTIEWSSEFDPQGAPETDAVQAIQGIYQAGFDNLKKMFGG